MIRDYSEGSGREGSGRGERVSNDASEDGQIGASTLTVLLENEFALVRIILVLPSSPIFPSFPCERNAQNMQV